jgi:hypothetical protein
MSKCPCCNRAFRRKKPKAETADEAYKRVMTKVRAEIVASLRKPMPPKTPYKGD